MAKRRDDEELVDVTDLVLTAPSVEGKVRRRRKQLTHAEEVAQMLASDKPSMQLRGEWCVAYQKKWGFPYSLHARTRELKHLGDMAHSWGKEAVSATIRLFFATTDPRVTRTNYTVADFNIHAARLRMAQSGNGDINDKTANNIHEISKAMGRKP